MAKKATNFEIIQRVKLVIEFLLDGLNANEICQYGSDNWQLSRRQTERYMRVANTRIERMANEIEKLSYGKIRSRLERQYRRAVQKGDGQLARLLIHDMRKLYGFDKPIKIAPTTPDGNNEYSGTPKETGFRIRKLLEAALADDSQGGNGKFRIQDNLSK